MKTKLVILVVTSILLLSCGANYDFWDISHFNMDESALADAEEIKILYISNGPDNNKDLTYYIHLVVVSQKTGDTVNVLTTAYNGITKNDSNKVFNFFNQDNLATKIIQLDTKMIEQLSHVNELDKIALKKIDKVARDPEFDHIADNGFPTIIGSIGVLENVAKSNVKRQKPLEDYTFTSYQEQADSIKSFMKKAIKAEGDEKAYWEQQFFCAFPNSYADMDSLFGYNSRTRTAGPLYYCNNTNFDELFNGHITYHQFFSSYCEIISYFAELNSVPQDLYYEKFINTCLHGRWQADNVQRAFSFGKRLIEYPKEACNALSTKSDSEIKSVFRFIFDDIHPEHDFNKRFYAELLPVVTGQNERLGKLLTEAYEQLMSENHEH